MDGLAGMQSDTGTADLFVDGPLVDGYGHMLEIYSATALKRKTVDKFKFSETSEIITSLAGKSTTFSFYAPDLL
jgi:hypothetical protein